ncbi:hypothetical protein TYRP_022603 [Tyrophagus putrescentiae]|nr:hypothetical protein TYRP_022603 [Tyrophagus putrescentiae]
MLAPLLAP